ncbi:MAG: energy transducer TonB [Bacteroidaceae bacterium]|nr:energy transducer TonB [Bacteroidaceae bacterium]
MKRVVFFVGVSLIAGVLGVKAQNNVKSSDFVRTPDSLLKLWEEQDEKEAKEPVANRIFQVVEERPQFPGGDVALMKYLQDSLRYPAVCVEQQLQGRVIVQFVVNPDSTISDAKVIKPVNPHFDKEALRVVNAMPKWIPGKLRGKPVRVRFTVPVTFRLEEPKKVEAVSEVSNSNNE